MLMSRNGNLFAYTNYPMMTNKPKVSIVIPAYNEEEHIAAALQSALKQNYSDFEIIVVNNNSHDNTANIIATFPVKVINEINKGTHFARERGRKEAQGEYLAYMDADCLPDPDWLQKGLECFSNKSVVAASGPYAYYDDSGFFLSISLFFQKYIYTLVNFILQTFKIGGTMIGGNSFFRSSALQAIGGFDTKITFYGDDTDTAKRISRQGKIVFSPKVIMRTSARRFKAEGKLNIMFKYWYYFFKHLF